METRKSAQICANNSLKTTFSFSLNHPHLFNHSTVTATVQPSGSNSRCSTLSRTFRQTLGCCLQLAMAKLQWQWQSPWGSGQANSNCKARTLLGKPQTSVFFKTPLGAGHKKKSPRKCDFYVISMGLSQIFKPKMLDYDSPCENCHFGVFPNLRQRSDGNSWPEGCSISWWWAFSQHVAVGGLKNVHSKRSMTFAQIWPSHTENHLPWSPSLGPFCKILAVTVINFSTAIRVRLLISLDLVEPILENLSNTNSFQTKALRSALRTD